MTLRQGWYLMTVRELERELAAWRAGDADPPPTGARRLSTEEALAFRNAGNLPDPAGRTLRLILEVDDAAELASLEEKRRLYEPDFQEPPTWRRPGSRAVNIVPLRNRQVRAASSERWWDEPELAALESEWERTGLVFGVRIPADYRGFVYKTVLSLRSAGKAVTVDSIVDSIRRWLDPADAERLRRALEEANSPFAG